MEAKEVWAFVKDHVEEWPKCEDWVVLYGHLCVACYLLPGDKNIRHMAQWLLVHGERYEADYDAVMQEVAKVVDGWDESHEIVVEIVNFSWENNETYWILYEHIERKG